MGDILDERKKGLEEEYFHRKNKEAVEKMREKMRVAEKAKAPAPPRCNVLAAMKSCMRPRSSRWKLMFAISVAVYGSIPANSSS